MTPPAPSSQEAGGIFAIGIGASAGGLEACRKLLDGLGAGDGMAFILIMHLDPTHESLVVELLSPHTPMTVLQAADGMRLEPGHLYVIPPGTYLSLRHGALRLSAPTERRGARLPFDFLLQSLATEYGANAACIVLSGTGADGARGARALSGSGGLVIVQDPKEAGFDGMPRSAIETGAADAVLPVAEIPQALSDRRHGQPPARGAAEAAPAEAMPDRLPDVVALLRSRTAQDFSLYKPGTLRRRIARRMATAAIAPGDMDRYLDLLRRDSDELQRLARDLRIHVTDFFRDPKVFAALADKIIPEMIRNRPSNQPLRIWIAGCSTGEEAYSLAMLFQEQIALQGSAVGLKIFASDVDPDAIATAREGLYPHTIAQTIGAERLARFFVREDSGYRVAPELRAAVVFAVQNLLSDPPFSRLDLISCRNLLIYLSPEAQAKVISLLHFALGCGGILLLGGAETVGVMDGRFEYVAKEARIYRRIGESRTHQRGLPMSADDIISVARPTSEPALKRQTALAELCRRLVTEAHAPATVLIDRRYACLYSLGPTQRYLRVAPGHPTSDLLAMVPAGLRSKLRAAIRQAEREKARVILAGGHARQDGTTRSVSIDVTPVQHDGETLFLVCFLDPPEQGGAPVRGLVVQNSPRVAELEQELEATRMDLEGVIRNLELSGEEQKSINEEYQSANEELLTSKEELQSLNEELTALNGQLQETLERHRVTSDDLQNVLYSTDVATIFLDMNLRIRFYTPATTKLFNIIPGDVGRPLSDLRSLAEDDTFEAEARAVLRTLAPIERDIRVREDGWFVRRILPYRTHDRKVEGVVITFVDATERKHASHVTELAKQQAELSTAAKSRFLAAASHDLRQPLQTLVLLQGLLAKTVGEQAAQKLVALMDPILGAMSGMLNTLLNINQIEAGTLSPEVAPVPIKDLLLRLHDEYAHLAEAKGLTLRMAPCDLVLRTDPALLEQILRNLLSNALKYTTYGKILIGCRRRAGLVSIEIWDTGIGIPAGEFEGIFEEYRQVHTPGQEKNSGLGLGLAIVQRLAALLGHAVGVRSRPGKGTVFNIDVALAADAAPRLPEPADTGHGRRSAGSAGRKGAILIIEDDADLRHLLELSLKEEGHGVVAVPDGSAALALVSRGAFRPDLLLADYNLPGGIDGLALVTKLRTRLGWQVPTIILTGDISTGALRAIAEGDCRHFHKPVKLDALGHALDTLLDAPGDMAGRRVRDDGSRRAPEPRVIHVVDDDSQVRTVIRAVLEESGQVVEDFPNAEAFLERHRPDRAGLLLIDVQLPGMDGIALLRRLTAMGNRLPAIMITGQSDIGTAVAAMKAGAVDFIEKPISRIELLERITRAFEQSQDAGRETAWREDAARSIATLTARQRAVLDQVLAGLPSKAIANELGISQRTVEHHRAAIMHKMGVASLPALARLVLAAEGGAYR
jgi:two-component system CheB/CheR fusion protein